MSIMLGDKFLYARWPTSVCKEILSILWKTMLHQRIYEKLLFQISVVISIYRSEYEFKMQIKKHNILCNIIKNFIFLLVRIL